jgi:hypothetical protein
LAGRWGLFVDRLFLYLALFASIIRITKMLSALNSPCFICSYAAPQESEITFKCGAANDEETKAERRKNASRGNLLLSFSSLFVCITLALLFLIYVPLVAFSV